jgi:hypothetical protein
MSTLTLVEQTNPGAQSAGQQKLYPKSTVNAPPNGALARVDATGVERVMIDTGSGSNALSMSQLYVNYGGI